MTKEQLIALGLTEEQAQAVLDGYGEVVPKSQFDDKITELKTANDTITARDKQIKDLEPLAVGNKDLLDQITKLQADNKVAADDYEAKLNETRLSSAVKLALTGKVQDLDIVSSLLDKTKIELDELGNVKGGLDDQLTTLKESKSFLFVPEKEEKKQPEFKGFTPTGGDNPKNPPASIGAAFAQMANGQIKTAEKTPWD